MSTLLNVFSTGRVHNSSYYVCLLKNVTGRVKFVVLDNNKSNSISSRGRLQVWLFSYNCKKFLDVVFHFFEDLLSGIFHFRVPGLLSHNKRSVNSRCQLILVTHGEKTHGP